jgi:hypothetical protein
MPITNGGAQFSLAGFFNGYSPGGQDAIGGYWSSTNANNGMIRGMILNIPNVNPLYDIGRNNGTSIRCVVK